MAQSNHERVGRALELLKEGLRPFVERKLADRYGDEAPRQAGSAGVGTSDGEPNLDVQALLKLIWTHWEEAFRSVLGAAERSLVAELQMVRNRWAHQEAFSTDDAYRALDSAHRLLAAICAPEAQTVERQKQELLRARFEEQARQEAKRATVVAISGRPTGGLRPWREVITPHPDVASGRYQQAEFAADLNQVYRGEGADEYRDPVEFFRRTFLTEGLKRLLTGALQRLSGAGGDPVMELQTNFGGGKTHSMLALYHLFSGVSPAELSGIDAVLAEAKVARPPVARRAVLVGQALCPAQPHTHPDGTTVRTFWGELAWQLLGREGYALVAEADRLGVSPGTNLLIQLFKRAAPCLVLIDEWVAHVRQLYGSSGLPAGSFDANISFAQSLTEAAKATRGTLVVASIPVSDIEQGGEGGREALARLKNIFARVQCPWRPASAEEGFEIVRRRLFEPLVDPQRCIARDAVVKAFAELYQSQAQEFPSQCREADYERRLQAAYPIHPELFDRLYNDWSSLDRFQRTRGVLRLMAAVIHTLWERQDAGLLILPASVPIDEPAVQFELTRYMEEPWVPVIEKDVDGLHSLPLRLDREQPNLGRYSACRRVARALYLGSAPTLHTANKGLEDRQVKLGCTQPGESVAIFGDALRRLTDQASHLYVDGRRYWFSTQPSVTRLAQDRAAQQAEDEVMEEIRRRLRAELSRRGDFARVHVCPSSGADVPDEPEARLVILGPEHPHSRKDEQSPARAAAATILDQRGSGPRIYRNTLVFLAPDRARLADLKQAARQYLAWRSIDAEREALNLDAFQANQAKEKCDQWDQTVKQRIPETYQWLLVPTQPRSEGLQETPPGSVAWDELRVSGEEPLADRASKKLRNEEHLITRLGAVCLRHHLDRVPLWREGEDHVRLKQLVSDFAQYLYLPRLKGPELLLEAAQEGAGSPSWQTDAFAYAAGWDDASGRYLGLTAGRADGITVSLEGFLVKPEVAAKQLDALEAETRPRGMERVEEADQLPIHDVRGAFLDPPSPKPRRFYGSVTLDANRIYSEAERVGKEVIQHLSALVGSQVEVTLELRALVPDGTPEEVVRAVTENCRTLKFSSYGFESA